LNNIFLSLWLKLSSLVFISIIPISFLLVKISNETSKNLEFKSEEVIEALVHYESLLKDENKRPGSNENLLRRAFQKSVDLRSKIEDQASLTNLFYDRIRVQALQWLFLVASFSILFSAFFSFSIKNQFHNLFLENLKNVNKLNALRQLESWQRALRVLVHEIRGPLTPLKLTISSLKEKSQLTPKEITESIESLMKYYEAGSRFSLEQISYIERLMQSFTSFTRLPEPQKKEESLIEIITDFIRITNDVYGVQVEFVRNNIVDGTDLVLVDRDLIITVLNNLFKNAKEAGASSYSLILELSGNGFYIDIKNNGPIIPSEISSGIFEFGLSSKLQSNGNNLGVGLTVCKKIMLDHGGDLFLHSNTLSSGVIFRLFIPKEQELK